MDKEKRTARMRKNLARRGGRPKRRTAPKAPVSQALSEPTEGPGKRADEKIISVPISQILPDRYQGRLRWPLELDTLERLYAGEWTAQMLLDEIARVRAQEKNPALETAWQDTIKLAHSILSEGQVVPITLSPTRRLPAGYRFVIETGEGRFWAYQMMQWLVANDPETLEVEPSEWREDPAYIRAVAIPSTSRLRQVAENEQRQSYASAVDRAVAYASMLAEDAGIAIEGSPPGIRHGTLELPHAYWQAAQQGLRNRRTVVQQVPAGTRQIQRHLKLLTDLDRRVLADAKRHGLSEAQLRSLVSKPPEEQRHLVDIIIGQGLSSREALTASRLVSEEPTLTEEELVAKVRNLPEGPKKPENPPAPLITPKPDLERSEAPLSASEGPPEPPLPPPPPKQSTFGGELATQKQDDPQAAIASEIANFLRSLTNATSRYEALHKQIDDQQLISLLDRQLRSYDDFARGRQRAKTPRHRIHKLQTLLAKLEGVRE